MIWNPDIKPTMISDDIAFVGGRPVSVHCLIAKEGLILLDSGYPGMLSGISRNMSALGLNIMDVRYILHSHGHVDHYGSTAELVRKTNAKTYIGKEDASIVLGNSDLSWAKELRINRAESFIPDVCFGDGDILQLAGRTIRCIHAPGHTLGTYAFFIDTYTHGIPMIAAMHGGVGINSMSASFLTNNGIPLSIRTQYRQSLHRLKNEKVDIVLGNHPDQNDTERKAQLKTQNYNPFVDPKEWVQFLHKCEGRLDQLLADERN